MPASGPPAVVPFFFTSEGRSLFACYRAPHPDRARNWGVVLCYPMGQEHIHSHRTCRQLEAALLANGFHVLRFDAYGCGDSEGLSEQARLGDWLADAASAVDQLRLRRPGVRVCLLGIRLGAALATLVAAGQRHIDALVLWDPVVTGSAYIEELRARHAVHEQSSRPGMDAADPVATGSEIVEFLGFSHSRAMVDDLERLDLLEIRRSPAASVLLIDSNPSPAHEGLRRRLEELRGVVDYKHIPGPQPWLRELYELAMPYQTLQAISSWVAKTCV